MALIWPSAGVIVDLGIDIAGAGGDPVTVWAIDAMAPYSLALSAVPRAALLVATSAALAGGRVGPGWLPAAGYVVAGLSLRGSAMPMATALFPLLGLSTLMFEAWLVVVAAVLLRAPRPA